MNHGLSESNIDVLIHPENSEETLEKVLCSKTNPLVDSSHDALVSSCSLPCQAVSEVPCNTIKAPKVEHSKHKVVWSEEGIKAYQKLLAMTLPTLESDYADIDLPETASAFLKSQITSLLEQLKPPTRPLILGNLQSPGNPLFLRKYVMH